MAVASWLGLIFTASELCLAVFKRANAAQSRSSDRGSLLMLWLVIFASVTVAYSLAAAMPSLRFGPSQLWIEFGSALFVAGLTVRWYSIFYLGRFFTVNVAIASDHQLVDSGPYRFVRHPSYTGALMAFLGLGLCLSNWASIAVIVLPAFFAFSRRIQVEEEALTVGLGDTYREYMRRTKALIPAIY
jgi:protein-S-isoprenylcysteine O-methyltransferase